MFDTLNALIQYLRAGQMLSLESTTYPGITEEEIKPRIEAGGFKIGRDIALIDSPERKDSGNCNYTLRSTPKLVSRPLKIVNPLI